MSARIAMLGLLTLGCAAAGPIDRVQGPGELCAWLCGPAAIAAGEIRVAGAAAWLPGVDAEWAWLDAAAPLAALARSGGGRVLTGALVLTGREALFLSWGAPPGAPRASGWAALVVWLLGIPRAPRYFPALRLAFSEIRAVRLLGAGGARSLLLLVDRAGVPQPLWYLRRGGAGIDSAANRLAYDFLMESARLPGLGAAAAGP